MASYSPSSTMPTPQSKAALEYFVQLPVSRDMICYLARATAQVIRCDTPPQVLANPVTDLTPPSTPPMGEALPSLEEYITSIVQRSHVQVPTLMTSLVYLARLREKLPPVAKGMACTLHRIFLASLILAAKNLNDSSPKNKHWARYTSVRGYPSFGFSITEVNLMEKQMLFLLDWDLRIRNEDLYTHFEPFLAPIRAQFVAQERMRQAQIAQQREAEILYAAKLQQQIQQQQQQQQSAYSGYAMDETRHSVARTPSLSPPTRSTAMSSPASVDDHLDSPMEETAPHQYTSTEAESGEVVVHIEARDAVKANPMIHRLQSSDDKPAKKARIGGTPSFLSRLLNHTTTTYTPTRLGA